MLEDIKAIIFDLDGTLVDSMWIWKDIDIDFLKKRNIEFADNIQSQIEGMSFTETAIFFKETYNLQENIEQIKKEWTDMAKDYYANKIELKEGVLDFLNFLKNNDIKMGIGTSNSRELATSVLNRHNIQDFFETMSTSCEVEKGKPSPDVFLKVAKDLDVEVSECIVFEDTYSGALAGKRANMKVIAVEDEASLIFKDKIEELVDRYIKNYYELNFLEMLL